MKKTHIIILSVIALLVITTSTILLVTREPDEPKAIQSKDESVVQVDLENDTIYFVGELTQEELIDLIEPKYSRTEHTYYLTNNEHNEKARDEVFSYDVFWVEYEGITRHFSIRTVSSFD